jgi:Asp-tRNA(Asn)/Glu-tRNA(Gln) amidotransferase A subunit family amidase
LLTLLEDGMRISGEVHAQNLKVVAHQRQIADDLFRDHDVLLAPSAIGEAPVELTTTGDPLFCRGWTLLGLPCIHLPFARGRTGLPVGLQLVGRFADDHRLLAAAHWVHERLTR